MWQLTAVDRDSDKQEYISYNHYRKVAKFQCFTEAIWRTSIYEHFILGAVLNI